jgi:multidrug efflux system membrane fusion protein
MHHMLHRGTAIKLPLEVGIPAMKTTRLALLLAALAVTGGGAWLLHASATPPATAAETQPAAPAVPVTARVAKQQNVPVYLTGLGTVQAFNTAVIKAQVNGLVIAIPAKEGQEVHQGDIVALIDPSPYKAALDQATAQRAEDTAQLQSAQLDLARYARLAKQSYAPVQQVDDQRATVNKLLATIQADSAAIETAQINLNNCTIRAPINGRVSFHQTDIGNLVETASQTGIVTITQDKPISVVFTLPEADLPRIQAAMAQRTLPVEAYSGDDKTLLGNGTLLTPNNTIDTTTGTIQLKATFANDKDGLWPGEFVNARLLIETLPQAVTVPLPAIQHGPDGLFVYTVKPDHTVQQQTVQLAYQDAESAVVSKGVQAGQTVVVTGQSRLAPGTKVAIDQPPPAGGAAKPVSTADNTATRG